MRLSPRAAAVFLLAGLAGWPLLGRWPVGETVLGLACFYGALAVAWNLYALTGAISLGHSAFFGLGAYGSALLGYHLGWSPALTVPVGAGVAVCYAGLWCLGFARLRGVYLGLATLAAVEIPRVIIDNWNSLTLGSQGLVGLPPLPRVPLGPLTLALGTDTRAQYFLLLALLAVSLLVHHAALTSRFGWAWRALRENETAAGLVGVPGWRHRSLALLLSAALTGVLGAIYAHILGILEPPLVFTLHLSALPLVFSIFGGRYHLLGPALGALLLYPVDQLLLRPWLPTGHAAVYGVMVILAILFFPRGVAAWLERRGAGGGEPGPKTASTGGGREAGAPADPDPPGAPGGPPCLEIRGVSKRFGRRLVLKEIQLTVQTGEVLAVLGPNGSGKTTLFNLISGVLKPTAGRILLFGTDITGWPAHRIVHRGLARTSQIPQPFPEMTVLENVAMGLMFGSPGVPRLEAALPRARELLELVGLTPQAHLPAGELPFADLQRLEVARALATGPRVLLLDEMAAGLGPQEVIQAARLIRLLKRQGLTLMLNDHLLTLTARVSDRLAALDQGELLAVGRPEEVLGHPAVRAAYLGEREENSDVSAAP
ncbi:MAG: branched-chain amino acid ABC transporter ATP-binding protein/permease [Syntrophobacterales bacterium]|nr:branched-chain amino acid ABC transporter ATP-binding protein/permease [Syntrophobacterales bacterium]